MQQKSMAKNGFYKAILNIFNLIIPLLVNPYISGLIDEPILNTYNYIYSVLGIFLSVASFGIYNYGVREVSRVRNNPVEMNRLFSSLFLIGIISNGLTTIAYVIFAATSSTQGYELAIYMVMLIQIVANVFYIEFINEAKENYGFITVKTMMIRILYLVSIFVFVRKRTDVVPYAIVVSATILLNNLASFFYLKRQIRFDFTHLEIRRHIPPLVVTLLMTNVEILYTTLDRVILGNTPSQTAVTEYLYPQNIVGMIAAVPLALINVAIPRLSSYLGENNRTDYLRVLNKTIQNYMAVVIPMCLGVAVLAPEIMQLYTRGVYTYAYPVLIISAFLRIAFSFQSIINHLVLYVNGMERLQTAFLAAFGVLNAATDGTLLALGLYTPATAMGTTAVIVVLYDITAYFYTQKKLGIHYQLFSKRVLGYLLASACFALISLGVRMLHLDMWLNIILIVVLCAGLYALYLVLTRDSFLTEIAARLPFKKKKNA